MNTVIAWLIFFVILAWILVGLFAQVWEESAEIAREEQRKADWREVNYWKQKSKHPMVHIKEMDGDVRNSKAKTVNMTVNEFILRR